MIDPDRPRFFASLNVTGAAIKPAVVDKVLGSKSYERYHKILDAFIEEQTRAFTNEQRFSSEWGRSMRAQLEADRKFAEKINDDYIALLEKVSLQGTGDVRDGEKILDIFVLAISILTLVNDVLDDIFGLGIASLLMALAAAGLEKEARELEALVKRLVQEMEKAKREVKEAYAQTALNLAITAGLACAGPLGWISLGAIGLGQMIADTYLGPATSDAATWGSRGTTTIGTAISASEKYVREASKVSKVMKPAGKAIPVVGFVFDVNEIAIGYSNVNGLKKLMADVKKNQDKLIEKLNFQKGTLANLGAKIIELRKEVEQRRKGWTAQTRETMDVEMRRTGYRPRV